MQETTSPEEMGVIEHSDPEKLAREPLISVVMLAYNHEPYIHDAIEGVLLQRVDFPIELIIAEDASPDNTLSIALDFQRRFPEFIRVLTSETNVGMIENGRRARAACRGKYVALCEGDDYWHHPLKLVMQVEILERNEDVALVHTEYDYRVGRRVLRNVFAARHLTPPKGRLVAELLRGYNLGTATIVHRRTVLAEFDASEFAQSNYLFGDYNRALYAAWKYRIEYLPISTATYRYMSGSAMNSGAVKTLRLRHSIIDCRRAFMSFAKIDLPDLRPIEVAERRLVYGAAYLAGDIEAFDVAAAWLERNDYEWRKSHRHRLRRVIMRVPIMLTLIRWRAALLWRWGVMKSMHRVTIEEQRHCALKGGN